MFVIGTCTQRRNPHSAPEGPWSAKMRLTTLTTMFAAILAIATSAAFAKKSFAQKRPPPPQQPATDGLAGIPPAPTGHRQPRMNDLPPGVAARQTDQGKSAEQPSP